jgi:2,3-bisphosphoglycerate-dependent phosphoglycerate mutase
VIQGAQRPLVVVRHGESTWNELRLVQGQNDEARLTPRGRDQAAAVAEELRAGSFDLVVTSDLRRASETASIIAEALQLTTLSDPLLRERNFGVAEGAPLDALVDVGIGDGVVTDDDLSPVGGETLREFLARAGEFVRKCSQRWPTERLLVVTHGGTIRAMQTYCAGTSFRGARWDRVGNCSILTITPPVGEA